MMRSRFVAARFRLAEDYQNVWQMHLRFEDGRCETISLFGGRVQAVRATANPYVFSSSELERIFSAFY